MQTLRAVEVFADQGPTAPPADRWSLGSGFVVRAQRVLTCAHVVGGASPDRDGGVWVRDLKAHEYRVDRIVAMDTNLDLAVLDVPGLARGAHPVGMCAIDPEKIDFIYGVTAVGFPLFKYARERPACMQHPLAQALGKIPTAENYHDNLVLKLQDPEAAQQPDTDSPWPGFSGGAVLHANQLIGVVMEDRPAEMKNTLVVRPIADAFEAQKIGSTRRADFVAALCDGRAPALAHLGARGGVMAEARLRPSRPKHNLPTDRDRFVDRMQDLEDVKKQLAAESLVTITGVGGCGKSRLALHAARSLVRRYRQGVWWLDLAETSSPGVIAKKLLQLLRGRERKDQSPLDSLVASLIPRQALLVLDNCDYVWEDARMVIGRVLQSCPRVRILVTTRQVLGMPCEAITELKPLPAPKAPPPTPPVETVSEFYAAQLFIDRATRIDKTFQVTNENVADFAGLLAHIEGIPLGIELAAAHVRSLSLAELATTLGERILIWGRDPRYATLPAVIDWSYNRLSSADKIVFARASVFRGGWTSRALQAVCIGDGVDDAAFNSVLARLVERSLVVASGSGVGKHYRMYEIVREYAWHQLVGTGGSAHPSQTSIDAARRHAEFYLHLAQQSCLTGADQPKWLACLEAEHDNVSAALDFWKQTRETANWTAMCLALIRFWFICGYWSEGRRRLEEVLAGAASDLDAAAVAKLHFAIGALAHRLADVDIARDEYAVSLQRYQELGDEIAIASVKANQASLAFDQGDLCEAERLFTESLATRRRLDDIWGQASPLRGLGLVAYARHDPDAARALITESQRFYAAACDVAGVGGVLILLGSIALEQHDWVSASDDFHHALDINQQLAARRNIACALLGLGRVALANADLVQAHDRFDESRAASLEAADVDNEAEAVRGLAEVAELQHDRDRAAGLRSELALLVGPGARDAVHVEYRPLPRIETIEVEFRQH